jgi:hypothetical protein
LKKFRRMIIRILSNRTWGRRDWKRSGGKNKLNLVFILNLS